MLQLRPLGGVGGALWQLFYFRPILLKFVAMASAQPPPRPPAPQKARERARHALGAVTTFLRGVPFQGVPFLGILPYLG